MKTIVNLLSVIAVFLAAAGSAQADEPILLRYKMSKGVKTLYRTTTQMKQKQTIMGNDMVTEMNGRSIDERVLVKVDEKGNFVVRTENKRFYSKFVNGQFGEYVYDSTNDERDTSSVLGGVLTPLYDRLNGAMLSFTYSPRGEVTAVKGYKDLLADILKDNPLAAQFFSEGGSDEAFKVQQNNSIVVLPKKPVKVGDTWEEPYVFNLKKLGKFTGKKTYTYEGPGKVGDRKTIKISLTTELTANLDIDTDGAKVTGTISVSESSGTAHFDPHKGQLVSLKSAMTMTGTLNVAAGGQNITIPMEQKLSATVELLGAVEREPAKQDALKRETTGIQGTWRCVSLEADGAMAPKEIVAALKLVFKDDTLTFKPGEPGNTNYRFKLDPTTKPASFDMTHADGSKKGKTQKGIYLLKGDRLEICFGEAGKRPKVLTAKAKSGQVMYTLQREKL